MATTTWQLDAAHSEVHFKVKHMMITNVTGSINNFDLHVESEGEDFSHAKVNFVATMKSISTKNEQRDGHIMGPDFFDVEKYPEMRFTATGFDDKDEDGNFHMHGDLTIKEVTKPVKLFVEFGGIGKDPWGNQKAGFTIQGKINREDFGLVWNAALETGGVLVDNIVKINAEIQLVKQG